MGVIKFEKPDETDQQSEELNPLGAWIEAAKLRKEKEEAERKKRNEQTTRDYRLRPRK